MCVCLDECKALREPRYCDVSRKTFAFDYADSEIKDRRSALIRTTPGTRAHANWLLVPLLRGHESTSLLQVDDIFLPGMSAGDARIARACLGGGSTWEEMTRAS